LSDLVGADHIVAGPGAARYVVDSKLARAVVFPGSVEEVSTTMAFASAEGLKVVPRGSGTKMALGGIPDRVDLEAGASKRIGDRLRDRGLVLDEKYPAAHHPPRESNSPATES